MGIREFRSKVSIGNLEEAVSEEGQDWNFDLVILGNNFLKQSLGFKKSQIQRIIDLTHCPVLIVRCKIALVPSILRYKKRLTGIQQLDRSVARVIGILEREMDIPPVSTAWG